MILYYDLLKAIKGILDFPQRNFYMQKQLTPEADRILKWFILHWSYPKPNSDGGTSEITHNCTEQRNTLSHN